MWDQSLQWTGEDEWVSDLEGLEQWILEVLMFLHVFIVDFFFFNQVILVVPYPKSDRIGWIRLNIYERLQKPFPFSVNVSEWAAFRQIHVPG